MPAQDLTKKYPRWTHRRAWHRKKEHLRRARKIVRRKRKRGRKPRVAPRDLTNVLLMQLLTQLNAKKPPYTPLFPRSEYRQAVKKRGRTLVV